MRANGSYGHRGGNRKKSKQRWNGREELPVNEVQYVEADGRYFLSGRAVFDILTVPIRVVVPWTPGNWEPHYGVPRDLRRELAMALKKVEMGASQKAAGQVAVTDADALPLILEYLMTEAYPDGSKRVTSSLVVVSDGSSWRVCLSDKDNSRVMWKSGPTLLDALQAVEMGLMADDPSDWRRSADASVKRRK